MSVLSITRLAFIASLLCPLMLHAGWGARGIPETEEEEEEPRQTQTICSCTTTLPGDYVDVEIDFLFNTNWWEVLDRSPMIQTKAYGEAGIGWISDTHFPWVFTYGLGEGEWIYIFETDSDRRGFYAYRPETENFLWASSEWGWYYEMGSDTGWSAFKN